jgi:hypothetical protein
LLLFLVKFLLKFLHHLVLPVLSENILNLFGDVLGVDRGRRLFLHNHRGDTLKATVNEDFGDLDARGVLSLHPS